MSLENPVSLFTRHNCPICLGMIAHQAMVMVNISAYFIVVKNDLLRFYVKVVRRKFLYLKFSKFVFIIAILISL